MSPHFEIVGGVACCRDACCGKHNVLRISQLEYSEDRRCMPPDEVSQYGESKAQEIQERRQRRRVADEKASVDGKLKTLWAPRLWQQIREEITQLVQSVNDAMGETVLACEDANPELVVVNVADTQSNLSAAFDSKAVR